MTSSILRDAGLRPKLFVWNGGLETPTLRNWMGERSWRLPEDLVQFWIVTGGGEAFETEILLPPLPAGPGREDIASTTSHYRPQGLPPQHLVFHEGLWVSAFDEATRTFVAFSRAHLVAEGRYPSFDAWYEGTLRAEYAERYGLPR